MTDADMFVGTVSAVLGVVLVVTAIYDGPWYRQLRTIRWLESACGHQGMRIAVGLAGLGLVTLGGFITF